MPPIQIASVAVADVSSGTAIVATLPLVARKGDALIVIGVVSNIAGAVDLAADQTLEILSSLATANGQIFVGRRFLDGTEPAFATYGLDLDAPATKLAGVAYVLRGTTAEGLSDAKIAAITASTNFAMPAVTPVRYSDLWIGITFAHSGACTFSTPLLANERADLNAGGIGFAVFDRAHDAPATVAAKTSVASIARTGIAAALLVPSEGLRGAGKKIPSVPMGMIGLPIKGV